MTFPFRRRLQIMLQVEVSVGADHIAIADRSEPEALIAAQEHLLAEILASPAATRFFIRQAAVVPLKHWIDNPELIGTKWLAEEEQHLASALAQLAPSEQDAIAAAREGCGPGPFDHVYASFMPNYVNLRVVESG